jgi:hypothetical protein
MASQAKIDAAMKAVRPLVDADIADAEKMAPVFMRRKVDEGIQAHRAQIDAYVLALVTTAIDAAEKVSAGS